MSFIVGNIVDDGLFDPNVGDKFKVDEQLIGLIEQLIFFRDRSPSVSSTNLLINALF